LPKGRNRKYIKEEGVNMHSTNGAEAVKEVGKQASDFPKAMPTLQKGRPMAT